MVVTSRLLWRLVVLAFAIVVISPASLARAQTHPTHGKGYMVTNMFMARKSVGDPRLPDSTQTVARKMASGMAPAEWVAIKCAHGSDQLRYQFDATTLQTFQNENIRVLGWQRLIYGDVSTATAQAKAAKQILKDTGCTGIILFPEDSVYINDKPATWSKAYIAELKNNSDPSLPAPSFIAYAPVMNKVAAHADIHQTFGDASAIIMPRLFWTAGKIGAYEAYEKVFAKNWKKISTGTKLVPIIQAEVMFLRDSSTRLPTKFPNYASSRVGQALMHLTDIDYNTDGVGMFPFEHMTLVDSVTFQNADLSLLCQPKPVWPAWSSPFVPSESEPQQ